MPRFLLVLTALFLPGCNINLEPPVVGSGNVTKQVREVGEFSEIHLQGAVDAEYTTGDPLLCEIEVDDNLQEMVTTKVEDGSLTISVEGNIAPSDRMRVKLASTKLDGITTAGSCNVIASGIDSQTFELSIAGSGKATLSGMTDALDISIAGSGNVGSLALAANDVSVSISGSGEVQVKAEQELKVNISGSGKVEFEGQAQVTQSISGSGSVKNIGSETETLPATQE